MRPAPPGHEANLMDDSPIPALSSYQIDETTGFVPPVDPLDALPDRFSPWEAIVPNTSALIRSRRLRQTLLALPVIDTNGLDDARSEERALLLLTSFANAWVWGGDSPDFDIPREIAIPLRALAARMGRPPLVHYASMALNNWQRVDPSGPIEPENMRMQVQLLGGVDEDWFFIGSLAVELAGAPLVGVVRSACLAAIGKDDDALAFELDAIAEAMEPVITALGRMRDWCDPHIFYHRVRPFLAGWPEPGARYLGVSDRPIVHVGGSAGQSSLLQSVDALLGVDHGTARTGTYLKLLRTYMPPGHRRFVEDIERTSRVIERVSTGHDRLRLAHKGAIAQVVRFRTNHIALARDYIVGPSRARDGVGTGGTDFAAFLDNARASTMAATG
ncbi:MAG: hypothetical protein JWR80_8844 [Bradyrhizobium sp.]|nr:hypothetical protein [Bradyrhizobium sp.]